VRWVVRHVRELAEGRALADLGAATAAAFFHDVIYDATAAGNEAASATLASRALGELGWADDRIELVGALILGTIDHRWGDTTRIEADVLFAADLGVLAADPAGYSAYVRNVRREYAHVSDADWAVGRSAVLDSFLAREAIYAPRLELTEWELRARGNLTAELDSLAG
jgi:predicted metal-dependent HD superfamily phosphohydrolase